MGVNPLYLKFKAFAKFYLDQGGVLNVNFADIRGLPAYDPYQAVLQAEEAYHNDDARGVDVWLSKARNAYIAGAQDVIKKRKRGG